MNKEKTPYLIENKERDTFTFYVKGTKPYLDLEKKVDQLTNNWNELEELISNLLKEADSTKSDLYIYEQNKAIMRMILDKMKEIKEGKNDIS